MLALEWLGFMLGSALFLFGSIMFLHRRGILHTLMVTAGSLAAIYLVFEVVFAVVLPEGRILR
jgi:hypothetical protein